MDDKSQREHMYDVQMHTYDFKLVYNFNRLIVN